MDYYVYAHSKSNTDLIDDIFYIGKGIGDRAKRKSHRNRYWNNVVNKNNGNFFIHYLQKNLTEENAFFFEKLYIDIFGKKIENGLLVNMTDGGEGISGHKLSDETKRKISKANKGRKISDEVKKKYSLMFSGSNNPMYGKNRSDETKKKISIANKNKLSYNKHWNWKGDIYQYDKNMNLIAIYNTSRQAEEITGISQSLIRNCIIGGYGRKSAGGFIWKRKSVKQV